VPSRRAGQYIAAKTAWYKGLPQPHEAEEHGLKEAINWFGTMRLPSVSIEFDYKQVVDDISSTFGTNSMFGAVLDVCKATLRNFQNFKITSLGDKRIIVHLLARESL